MKFYSLQWAVLLVGSACAVTAMPSITKQPSGTNFVSLGASITNRVTATSTNPPLNYQWKLNGVEIAGAVTN